VPSSKYAHTHTHKHWRTRGESKIERGRQMKSEKGEKEEEANGVTAAPFASGKKWPLKSFVKCGGHDNWTKSRRVLLLVRFFNFYISLCAERTHICKYFHHHPHQQTKQEQQPCAASCPLLHAEK